MVYLVVWSGRQRLRLPLPAPAKQTHRAEAAGQERESGGKRGCGARSRSLSKPLAYTPAPRRIRPCSKPLLCAKWRDPSGVHWPREWLPGSSSAHASAAVHRVHTGLVDEVDALGVKGLAERLVKPTSAHRILRIEKAAWCGGPPLLPLTLNSFRWRPLAPSASCASRADLSRRCQLRRVGVRQGEAWNRPSW